MALSPEERDRLALLERIVATMGSPTREVFLMHRLESLGYPEIGERLGLSVREVEQHLVDALVHLSREMDRAEQGIGSG